MRPQNWTKRFKYAFDGIVYCFASQQNMRIHAIAAVIALALALYFRLTPTELVLLVLTIAGVMVAEMVNTAIETVVDLVSPEYHRLAQIAKDVAAGAVMLMAGVALIVGCLLFLPKLFF